MDYVAIITIEMDQVGRSKHFSLDAYLAHKEGSFLAKQQSQQQHQPSLSQSSYQRLQQVLPNNKSSRVKCQTTGAQLMAEMILEDLSASLENTQVLTPPPPSYSSYIQVEATAPVLDADPLVEDLDILKGRVMSFIGDRVEEGLSVMLNRMKHTLQLAKNLQTFLKRTFECYAVQGKESLKLIASLSQDKKEDFLTFDLCWQGVLEAQKGIAELLTRASTTLISEAEELSDCIKIHSKSRKQIKEESAKVKRIMEENEELCEKIKTKMEGLEKKKAGTGLFVMRQEELLAKREATAAMYEKQRKLCKELRMQYENNQLPLFIKTLVECDYELMQSMNKHLHSYKEAMREISNCMCVNGGGINKSIGLLKEKDDLINYVEKFLERPLADERGILKIEQGFQAPFVIQKCIEAISKRGIDSPGLYRISSSVVQLERIKQQLQSDPLSVDFASLDLDLIAGLCKSYLRDLKEPLVSQTILRELLACNEDKLGKIKLILSSKLAPSNFSCLSYLIRHLFQ